MRSYVHVLEVLSRPVSLRTPGPKSAPSMTDIPARTGHGRGKVATLADIQATYIRHPHSLEPDMNLFALSTTSPASVHGPIAIGLNGPGKFYTWSFIDISLANLIVIVVMVVIFGLALLIRFPHARSGVLPPDDHAEELTSQAAQPASGDADMWTAKARTKVAQMLPPK